MTAEQMRREAADIAEAHPHVLTDETPPVPAVVVTVPGDLAARPFEIAVHHRPWGAIEVDYREKPEHAWIPIGHVGGTFEPR